MTKRRTEHDFKRDLAAKKQAGAIASIVSKTGTCARFGNDTTGDIVSNGTPVVSKSVLNGQFGNDADVVSKCLAGATFGNDAMFVRVRRRTLKGGHPDMRDYLKRAGELVTASTSYDVVRAVRVDGKPRQKFLFGLGSLKANTTGRALARFWINAERRMQKHGLSEDRQERLIEAMVRKGAPRPSSTEVEKLKENRKELECKYPQFMAALREAEQ